MTLDEAVAYTTDLLVKAKDNMDGIPDLIDPAQFMEANAALHGAVKNFPKARVFIDGLDLMAELIVW